MPTIKTLKTTKTYKTLTPKQPIPERNAKFFKGEAMGSRGERVESLINKASKSGGPIKQKATPLARTKKA